MSPHQMPLTKDDYLESALSYAEAYGWHVFPVLPGRKEPATAHGLLDATDSPEKIREFWSRMPNANIGARTGGAISVLDIDPRHGGDHSLEELVRRHGDLPHTPMSLTGGGGTQYFFKTPPVELKNRANMLPGVDFRGKNGYAVVPPSRHPSGNRYHWECSAHPAEVLLAPMPEWLIELVQGGAGEKSARPSSEWTDLCRNGVREGSRNECTARLIGHLLRRFVDPRVALELVRAWNVARNVPPLPDDEVARVAESVAASELRRRKQIGGRDA